MSNELAMTSANAVTAFIPDGFDQVLEYSRLITASQMAPRDLNTLEKVAIAIFHGKELGLTPLAALQSIAVINGRPSIWGDGAMALVISNPLCMSVREYYEGEGAELKAVCEAYRRGWDEPVIAEFSMADAKTANLLNKDGPWKQYPKRMLKMRARAFCLRDAFADIFRGLGIVEEQQDIMRNITPSEEAPSAPSAPKNDQPARLVEGEVIEPQKRATKPKPVETKPDLVTPKAEERAEQEPERKPAPESDAPRAPADPPKKPANDEPAETDPAKMGFKDYAAWMRKSLFACGLDDAAANEIWKRRRRDWSDEQNLALIELRDRYRKWWDEQEEPENEQQSQGSKDESDPFADFDATAFHEATLKAIAQAKVGKEALDIKDKIDMLVEAGKLSSGQAEAWFEDPLTDALTRLPD